MSIIQRVPWTVQPQQPVMATAQAKSEGLLDGFLHPSWSLSGRPITGSLPIGVGTTGLNFTSASSSSLRNFANFTSPQTSELTVIVLARRDGAQPDSGFGTTLLFPKTAGMQDPFIHFIKTSGERIRFNTGTSDDNGNFWETTTDWVVGKWMVGAYVFRSGSVPVVYRDGVAQSLSFGSALTLTGSLKASSAAQINLAALRLNGAIGGALVYTKALPAVTIKRITDSIYGVLQPLSRRIWVPSAGGTTYTLSADSGAFALTGTAATLKLNRSLSAESGSFALTGTAASIKANRLLSAASGAFALAGAAATLKANRAITAASGSFALAGTAATLTYNPVGGPTYTLAAASGNVALTGTDAALTSHRRLTADSGTFTLTGTAASIRANHVLAAAAGSIVLAGAAATLTYSGAGAAGPLILAGSARHATALAGSARHAATLLGSVAHV